MAALGTEIRERDWPLAENILTLMKLPMPLATKQMTSKKKKRLRILCDKPLPFFIYFFFKLS